MLKVKEWAAAVKVYLVNAKIAVACFSQFFSYYLFFSCERATGGAPFQAGKTETSEIEVQSKYHGSQGKLHT